MAEEPLWPRETGRFVSERSRDVHVCEEGVGQVAELLYGLRHSEVLTARGWSLMNPLAPAPGGDAALDWLLVVDTMNFSFWPDDPNEQCEVICRGKNYTGYMALCAAITRALDEGVAITDPAYFSKMSLEDLGRVLRSDSEVPMPMLSERHKVLTDVGRALLAHSGSFRCFLEPCNNNALKMVQRIVEILPSYRDEAIFEGRRVALYKRAQILVAEVCCVLEAGGQGSLSDMDQLTMFADYRVPQALVHLGALRYSDELMDALKKGELLSSGDRREVEIRGCSIDAVEQIREHLLRLVSQRDGEVCHINSALIDFFLWPYAKDHHKEMAHIPIHHTRCIYY
ncbi:queuosine salvage protein [Clupea harengus]|uniref:Queuosine 5'-phosphate N-glycosylase/hydrolase n=1 Tax=Clupea harengus TaxID=7950 RepID=A0A6P8FUR0_CLUHA|nr:queuosine salvage protein [Clupea harengus]XP_031426878.1 queuosine salvage protein [Clupea harengus]